MENAGKSANAKPTTKRKVQPLWVRFIHYLIRQRRKRKAEKQPEAPADTAARRTATATVAIAFFTLVLVVVSYFQWKEIHDGGKDTHDLAGAAKNQADRMQDFANRMKDQNDRTKDLADRMKDQADRTKDLVAQATIQAKETRIAANAAKSASETAKDALHVTERAYLIAGQPLPEWGNRLITIQLLNTGHTPSGAVEVVTHEATFNLTSAASHPQFRQADEKSWQRIKYPQISPTVPAELSVAVPLADANRIEKGDQIVIVVGFATYFDGFKGTAQQRQPFCFQTILQTVAKKSFIALCDPSYVLPQMEAVDGYPNNEAEHYDTEAK